MSTAIDITTIQHSWVINHTRSSVNLRVEWQHVSYTKVFMLNMMTREYLHARLLNATQTGSNSLLLSFDMLSCVVTGDGVEVTQPLVPTISIIDGVVVVIACGSQYVVGDANVILRGALDNYLGTNIVWNNNGVYQLDASRTAVALTAIAPK